MPTGPLLPAPPEQALRRHRMTLWGHPGKKGLSKGLPPPTLGPSGRQTFKPGRALQPTGSSPKDEASLARDA